MQPHKHHEGDVNLELVQGIQKKLLDAWQKTSLPVEDPGLACCLIGWCQQFQDALIRLERVENRLSGGFLITEEYDGKVVDICLSIIDDYEQASSKNFINPDYVET